MAYVEADTEHVCCGVLQPYRFPYAAFRSSCIHQITDGFRESNYIGRFQFGKVYRGMYGGVEVMVKVWEDQGIHEARKPDNMQRFRYERGLFKELANHPDRPNLPFMIGGSYAGSIVAAVYNMKPKNTLYNLIDKGLLWVLCYLKPCWIACWRNFGTAKERDDLYYLEEARRNFG